MISFNRIIELPNHHIAVNGTFSSIIDIIDTTHYLRIKQIKCEGYMVRNNNLGEMSLSSLHLLKNGMFIYTKNGCVCQFSATNYQELFKYKKEGEFRGFATISSSDGAL